MKKDRLLIEKIQSGGIVSLLNLIYLLRCNLFHGAKALSESHFQPLNAGYTVLNAIIPPFLDKIERRIRSAHNHI